MKRINYHHGDLRNALLDNAEIELEDVGIEKLSLRKVGQRAGVSHTAFAHHFGDARGLLTALAERGFKLFDAALKEAQQDAAGRSIDPLLSSGLAYINFALEHGQLFQLMFASSQPGFSDLTLSETSFKAFSAFRNVHTESPSGRFGDNSTDIPALAFWAKVHGLASLLLTGRMNSVLSLNLDQRGQAILDILAHE